MMIRLTALVAALCALVASSAMAAPVFTVTPQGANAASNLEWLVEVTPDPALFSGTPPGGSLEIELAFSVEGGDGGGGLGGFGNIEVNTVTWDFENPDNNPFTGTITEGLWLNPLTDPVREAFGAFGSIVFESSDPVRLFTIETLGTSRTTLFYGTAASGDDVLGARIAQAGINFDGYSGSVTVPEPAAFILIGMSLATLACINRQRHGA